MSIPSKDVLNVAKVFSVNGTIDFKRKSAKSFTIPIYDSPRIFSINVSPGVQFILTPMSLTLQAKTDLVSVRDLLDDGRLLRRAYFLCYSDQNVAFIDRDFSCTIMLGQGGNEYQLRCRIFLSKYDKFYSGLVPKTKRQHYIVQVKHVYLTEKRCRHP